MVIENDKLFRSVTEKTSEIRRSVVDKNKKICQSVIDKSQEFQQSLAAKKYKFHLSGALKKSQIFPIDQKNANFVNWLLITITNFVSHSLQKIGISSISCCKKMQTLSFGL